MTKGPWLGASKGAGDRLTPLLTYTGERFSIRPQNKVPDMGIRSESTTTFKAKK